MILQFQKIKKIGCYDDFVFDSKQLKPFGKANILYGSNGSGKTTVSNLLFLLSRHCKEKTALFDELLDATSELEILTDSGKITNKNIAEKNLDIYVFNSKFIADHVYNGTVANIDSFSKDIKLTSPEIEKLDNIIDRLNKRIEKLNKWVTQIENKLEGIFRSYNHEFQKKVSGSRLVNVKPSISNKQLGDITILKKELENLYKEYSKKSKETNTVEKFASLIDRVNSILNLDIDIDELIKMLKTKISTEAKGKVGNRISSFQKAIEDKNVTSIGDLNDWFKKGGRLLHISKDIEKHCPLCDTDLSINIDSIIDEYSNYFNDVLLNLLDFIDLANLSFEPFIAKGQINKNERIILDLIDTCKNEFNFDIEQFTFLPERNNLLSDAIKEISELLKQKKQNPNTELLIQTEHIQIIKDYRTSLTEFKSAALTRIQQELATIQGKSIESIIKEIKAKIGLISAVELNLESNNIFKSSGKRNSDIAKICEKLIKQLRELVSSEEVKKIDEVAKLNAESKYINIYLKHFGITNFEVDRDKVKTLNNLVITYRSGKRKTSLNHSLSEGEKTALAFAYFISKLRVEKIEGSPNGFENSIIIIDDPISSLDDNRLFQTANLIDSFLFYNKIKLTEDGVEEISHHPSQLFILSHNLTFVKYLHNALKTNEHLANNIQEYFLTQQSPRIRKLPSGLKNFTNTYIVKLKEIVDFKEKKIEYEIVKNYLPNYIRIVLETFLSFKLALVNDSHDRLPGLSHLIKGIVREFDLIDDVIIGGIDKDGAIKRLNHLKKIADHESHGSIYRAEEFAFISEQELKEFAKNTVQVIEYIDNLHFRKIKSHV